jgi:osmoprotectant transport system permease protein
VITRRQKKVKWFIQNTSSNGEHTDCLLIQAEKGMGMTRFQRLLIIELPLALPTIIAGVKTSFIINIAARTVGAVIGAGGLGMPIVSGIRSNNPVLLLKGAWLS